MVSTTRSRRPGIVAALLAAVLAVSGLALVSATSASASDSSMFDAVNAARAANGQSAYAWNSHLASVAAGQAQRMASKHDLYHNPNLASDVGDFRWVGENVGYGPNSAAIEDAFMHSAPHRANILDPDYTQIGIASVMDGQGRLWVAQVFREPLGSAPAAVRTHRSPSHPHHVVSRVRTHAGNATAGSGSSGSSRSHGSSGSSTGTSTPAGPTRPATVRHPAVHPAPAPTLAQRVSYVTAEAQPSGTDPLADALAFAVTMNAVGD